jgi:hypothetical protein
MTQSWSAVRIDLCQMSAPLALGADTSGTPEYSDPGVAPEMTCAIAAFVGSWQIDESYPASHIYPCGGKGRGTQVGTLVVVPGGRSLIYKYQSNQPDGTMNAMAALWWGRTKLQ